MKDTLLADEIAAWLRSDPAFLTAIPLVATAGQVANPPALVVSGEYKPYGPIFRRGILSLNLRSAMGDEKAEPNNHESYFETLYTKFLGTNAGDYPTVLSNQAAAKTALQNALLTSGKVAIIDYGLALDAIAADSQDNELQTILRLNVVWKFLPAV